MTDEPLTIGELGGYTNNQMNKEGLKKLVKKVNEGGGGTTYTAGDNIQISAQNVISATDTTYTAGSGIAISEQNVISATGGGSGGDWILADNANSIISVIGNPFKSDVMVKVRYSVKANYPCYHQFYFKKGTVPINAQFSFIAKFGNEAYLCYGRITRGNTITGYSISSLMINTNDSTITNINDVALDNVYNDNQLSDGIQFYYKE